MLLGAPDKDRTIQPLDDYQKHSENARALKLALTQAERLHKDAIRRGDVAATDYMRRMHYVTVGLFAENLLRKTIANPDGFSDVERALVNKTRSQIDRWNLAVDLAFRRHYSVPFHIGIDASSIGVVRAGQYTLIMRLLKDRLEQIVSDRNKIAHAQWVWKLNSKGTQFSAAPTLLNYRQIAIRAKLVWEISEMISALAISEPTFDKVFDSHATKIGELESELDDDGYGELVAQLKSRTRN